MVLVFFNRERENEKNEKENRSYWTLFFFPRFRFSRAQLKIAATVVCVYDVFRESKIEEKNIYFLSYLPPPPHTRARTLGKTRELFANGRV